MDRVIENGRVAVLISPSYGAGWYTWNTKYEDLLFDPMIVEMIRNDRREEIEPYVAKKHNGKVYCGGVSDLEISWVGLGERFRVHEYDGSESIVLEADETWITA